MKPAEMYQQASHLWSAVDDLRVWHGVASAVKETRQGHSQDVVLTETEREGRWSGSVLWEDCGFWRALVWEVATEVCERPDRRQPGERRQITVRGRTFEEM